MRYLFSVIIVISLAFISGCAVQRTSSTSQSSRYSEDLSVWRPKEQLPADTSKTTSLPDKGKTTYVEARHAINEPLNTVLDSISRINLSRKFIDGFTIQVYSGLDREAALNAKKDLSISLPDLESHIRYDQPNFKVKAGGYYTRLDAQKDFVAIKRHFPSAIVIPDKIPIN